MKKHTNSSNTLPTTIATLAAVASICSAILYQYHEAVRIYRPDDISNTFGLYLLVLSLGLWLVFFVVRFINRR